MTQRFSGSRTLSFLCGLLFFAAPRCLAAAIGANLGAGPAPAAISAYDSYIRAVESRLAAQHRSPHAFLAPARPAGQDEQLRGQFSRVSPVTLEQLTPPAGLALPGALLHHWRGTVFLPGARAAGLEALLRNISAYPQVFNPQVLQAHVVAQPNGHFQVSMRVRQHHIITVVLDTTCDVIFAQADDRPDDNHGYSISRCDQISEIASPGTPKERALSPGADHGFLWRLNTYWTWEQRDNGLYIQIESISLTRSIPSGLNWAIGPYVESVPRDSLDFTLRSACNALRKEKQ